MLEPPQPSGSALVPVRLWRIWAKWSKTGGDAPTEGETYHPLICHLLDVAIVARHLWEAGLPGPTRERLTRHLSLSDEATTSAWIAFFTGLHDIGKASPSFQDQLSDTPAGDTIRAWMREAGLDFTGAEWVRHGFVSARLLGGMLEDLRVSAELADQIAALVGGHHGVFPRQLDLKGLKDRQHIGYGTWDTIREELVAALRAGLRVPDLAPTGKLTPADALVFAGFVSVADWIGSNERHFRHAGRLAAAPEPASLAEYTALSEQRAIEALRMVRMDPFTGAPAERTRRTFSQLFPKIEKPRDAQLAAIELADRLTGPALVILEAPMGEGKTEAALYLADAWGASLDRQGAYIALPTQATSDQLFERVRRYLELRFKGSDYVTAHLVYGEAPLNDSYQQMFDQGREVLSAAQSMPSAGAEAGMDEGNGSDSGEGTNTERAWGPLDETVALKSEGPVYDGRGREGGEEGSVIAVEWFAAPKRALLAPYGVGTIDQALLGVLQTKHFFVRLFGLAGKTVILDEVHAYDTYMSALLDRLLEWLGAFGVPVVLLSATLPKAKRAQLQRAYASYAGWPEPSGAKDQTDYPRLTWLSADGPGSRAVAASAEMSRTVQIEWLDTAAPDSEEGLAVLGERLRLALAEGGCAAVICNTVGRAQAVYTALKRYFPDTADDEMPELDLLHARFPRGARNQPGSRAGREARVLWRFGLGEDGQRNPHRPRRAILVATQVIEQSLDLDFDLMISDLAPCDLLLQRAGRLHRHRVNDPYRPPAVSIPRLLIPRPEERDGCPRFPRSDEFVYDAYFLLRTWITLEGRTQMRLPDDIEGLVEEVYDLDSTCPEDVPPAVQAAWTRTYGKHEEEERHELDEAHMRRLPAPKDDSVYTGGNLMLKEEDEAPAADDVALALTRLGPPSVRAILLPEDWARREREATGRPPGIQETRRLLSRSVPISHLAVAPALIQQEPPERWKKSPWLRHTRLVALDDNDQAIIVIPRKEGVTTRKYALRLDPDLGVVIERQAKQDA